MSDDGMSLDEHMAAFRAREDLESRRAYIHESAHVVIGHVLGESHSSVHVIGSGGRADGIPPGRDEDPRNEEAMVSIAAGEEAERVFGLPDPGRGSGPDREKERMFAGRTKSWMSVAELDQAVAKAHERAAALCREHRPAIERFADTLRVHGRLGGDEVDIALRAAFAGWPTPKFDAESRFQVMLRTRQVFEDLYQDHFDDDQRAEAWAEAEERAWTGRPSTRWSDTLATQVELARKRVEVRSLTDWHGSSAARSAALRYVGPASLDAMLRTSDRASGAGTS